MSRQPLPPGTAGQIKAYREGNRWVARCRYRDHSGRMTYPERYAATKTKAENRLREALRDWTEQVSGAEVTSDTYVRELLTPYLDDLRLAGRSPNTIRLYEGHARNHVLPALGALKVRECTVPRIDKLIRDLRTRHGVGKDGSDGYGVETIRAVRAVVSGMLGRAVRHGAIDTNPVREIGRIEAGGAKDAARALTLPERLDLLRKMDADERAHDLDLPDLCRFMLGTGVRVSEALAPWWDEVDTDSDTPTVQIGPNIIRVRGEGLVRYRGKTPTALRPVPLPAFLTVVLDARRHDAAVGAQVPVFAALRGKTKGRGYRDPNNVIRAFRDALDRAGYPWMSSHVFRKTAATVWDETGLTVREIADLLGHARVSMTQDTYFGRARSANHRAADLLQRAMFARNVGDS